MDKANALTDIRMGIPRCGFSPYQRNILIKVSKLLPSCPSTLLSSHIAIVNFYIVNLHEAVGQSPVTSFGSVRAPYVCIQAYGFHNIDTQIEGEVRDVKFLDDTSYVALLVPEEGPSTLVHCRLPDLENQHDLDAIGSVEDEEKLHVHVFPEDGGFVPNRLLVNGRKGRQSVVVLEKENRGWKILDLGAGSSGRGDDAADEDGNSMTAD